MRAIWVDYLRILAIVAVIFIHASGGVFKHFEFSTLNWWLANFVNTISRFSVPLFVMISGFLILGKDSTIKEFYLKKSIRIIPPLIFWSLFYVFFRQYLNDDINLFSLLKNTVTQLIIKGKTAIHLWYLSMFSCLMLVAPFLNKFVLGKKLNHSDVVYLFWVIAIIAVLQQISPMFKYIKGDNISWFTQFPWFIGYFLLGYYIGNNTLKTQIKPLVLIAILATILLFSLFANYILVFDLRVIKDWLILSNTGILNLVSTCIIFYIFFIYKDKLPYFNFIPSLSNASFGVYLIHPFFIIIFNRLELFDIYNSAFHFIIYILSVIFCSFLSIIILRKMKYFKYVS